MQLNELIQELVPEAIEVLRTILHNEAASPSVHLRAALAVLKFASAAEPQTEPTPTPAPQPQSAELAQLRTTVQKIENVHKSAQQQPIRRPAEPGRNSQCPCSSGLKYKRCCANKPAPALAPTTAVA